MVQLCAGCGELKMTLSQRWRKCWLNTLHWKVWRSTDSWTYSATSVSAGSFSPSSWLSSLCSSAASMPWVTKSQCTNCTCSIWELLKWGCLFCQNTYHTLPIQEAGWIILGRKQKTHTVQSRVIYFPSKENLILFMTSFIAISQKLLLSSFCPFIIYDNFDYGVPIAQLVDHCINHPKGHRFKP